MFHCFTAAGVISILLINSGYIHWLCWQIIDWSLHSFGDFVEAHLAQLQSWEIGWKGGHRVPPLYWTISGNLWVLINVEQAFIGLGLVWWFICRLPCSWFSVLALRLHVLLMSLQQVFCHLKSPEGAARKPAWCCNQQARWRRWRWAHFFFHHTTLKWLLISAEFFICWLLRKKNKILTTAAVYSVL